MRKRQGIRILNFGNHQGINIKYYENITIIDDIKIIVDVLGVEHYIYDKESNTQTKADQESCRINAIQDLEFGE